MNVSEKNFANNSVMDKKNFEKDINKYKKEKEDLNNKIKEQKSYIEKLMEKNKKLDEKFNEVNQENIAIKKKYSTLKENQEQLIMLINKQVNDGIISINKLCYGLCARTVIRTLENEASVVDMKVIKLLLERLGKSPNKLLRNI